MTPINVVKLREELTLENSAYKEFVEQLLKAIEIQKEAIATYIDDPGAGIDILDNAEAEVRKLVDFEGSKESV